MRGYEGWDIRLKATKDYLRLAGHDLAMQSWLDESKLWRNRWFKFINYFFLK